MADTRRTPRELRWPSFDESNWALDRFDVIADQRGTDVALRSTVSLLGVCPARA
jgi:hypothetical protein